MNKFTRKMMLAIACIIAGCINVQAQQIKGDFDAEWVTDTKGNGSLPGQFLRPGTQPVGWEASNVNQKVLMEKKEIVVTPDADRTKETGYSVKMENKYVGVSSMGSNTPAYITLGVPWVYAVMDLDACDGGTIGGIDFSFRPDSIVGHYKRTVTAAENALILTYFWKGNCTSTVKTNPKGSLLSSSTAEVQNKDLCILGKEIPTSGDAQLIAKGEYNITEAINDWTRISVPIDYYLDEVPEKMNIIISSANYWDRKAIQAGNILYADDIEFIYNSKLESLKIGDVAVDGFDKNTYNYTIIGDGVVPTEDQIEAVSDGKGASITQSTNGNTITITVSGNDISINPENKHVYTLTFAKDLQVEKFAGIYNGSIDIDLSVMGAEPPVLTVPDQITIEKSEINELQLTLKNFSFIGLTLGDITVDKISVTENGSNYDINSKEPVTLSLMGGSIQASVSVSGTIQADGTTTATIDVDATGLGKIPVTFKGKKIEEGLRLNELAISGEANAITFDPNVFNYKSLDITSTDILTYTADPSLKVNISMDGNWIYLNVTDGDKANIYKLANADISKPIKAITVNQAIDGNLELSNGSEINGNATVSGTISYVKQIDGNAWNVIGLPFIPTVNAITDNTTVPAEADWYTYTNENGEYKPQSLSAVNNACIMKLKTYNEATALELISIAGSSIKGGELTITKGYNICPNNTLATQKLTDLITADTYYLFDQTAQVFNIVSEPSTATVAPSEMFIALKGNNPVATIVTPDVYEQGIENNGTIEIAKVYSTNGNVFVQGYTGTVDIYLLNGGKVAQKEVSGNDMFRLEPNTYIIRTGTKATIVIVK